MIYLLHISSLSFPRPHTHPWQHQSVSRHSHNILIQRDQNTKDKKKNTHTPPRPKTTTIWKIPPTDPIAATTSNAALLPSSSQHPTLLHHLSHHITYSTRHNISSIHHTPPTSKGIIIIFALQGSRLVQVLCVLYIYILYVPRT